MSKVGEHYRERKEMGIIENPPSRFASKISECCEARLYKYNHQWDDGICSKCNEHTPAQKQGEKNEG